MWIPSGLQLKVSTSDRTQQPDDPFHGVDVSPLRNLLDTLKEMASALQNDLLPPHLTLTSGSSVQIACYPGDGSRYVKHIDAHKKRSPGVDKGRSDGAKSQRLFTFLYYLNDEWSPEDGGCLRIHDVDHAKSKYWDIEPRCANP